ncbi:hypothetical protein K435DRAFT_674954, partial [Dendrothele bispora CBS 962.96]
FKKATQEVNRSPVTDHNVNDDYVKNPPQKPEGAYETDLMGPSVLGQEGLGRPKHMDVEGEIVRESTVHSNF